MGEPETRQQALQRAWQGVVSMIGALPIRTGEDAKAQAALFANVFWARFGEAREPGAATALVRDMTLTLESLVAKIEAATGRSATDVAGDSLAQALQLAELARENDTLLPTIEDLEDAMRGLPKEQKS